MSSAENDADISGEHSVILRNIARHVEEGNRGDEGKQIAMTHRGGEAEESGKNPRGKRANGCRFRPNGRNDEGDQKI